MSQEPLRFDVFGRPMLIVREGSRWTGYYVGSEGKRRRADDLVIPPDLTEAQIGTYLADLFHERATKNHPDVRRLDQMGS